MRYSSIELSTQTIHDAIGGDLLAQRAILGALYERLHAGAAHLGRRMGLAGTDHDPTLWVNEALARTFGQRQKLWRSRGQFIASTRRNLSRIVVDACRVTRDEKRRLGGLTGELASAPDLDRAIDLQDLLQRLGRKQPLWPRIVHLRWIEGCTLPEIGARLFMTPRAVQCELDRALEHLRFMALDLRGPQFR